MNRKAQRAAGKAQRAGGELGVLYAQAVSAHQAGQLEIAAALYAQILKADPRHAAVLHLRGVLAGQMGDAAAGIRLIRKAIALDPRVVDYHYNLALTLTQAGQAEAAVASYRAALALRADYPGAHYNLAGVLVQLGRVDEGIRHYRQALAVMPGHADTLNNLGIALGITGQVPEAIVSFRAALASNPKLAGAHSNLGKLLHENGMLEEALGCYAEALRLQPLFAEAQINLGNTLRALGQYAAAVAAYEAGIRMAPDHAGAFINLGGVFKELGLLSKAIACFRKAIDLEPNQHPEAHYNLGLAFLKAGFYQQGWDGYEWRWRVENHTTQPRPHPQPMWLGDVSSDGPILLWPEQGLGDSIQFVRYAPLIAQSGRKVILEAPAALKRLFETIPGVNVISAGDAAHDFSVHCPLLSLPRAFGTTLETIPGIVPYLHPPKDVVAYWHKQLAECPGVKVGITWRGNPNHQRDKMRSMTPALFSRFLEDIPGLCIVSLEQDGRGDECRALGQQMTILNAGPQLGDMADTAGLIANLDLVISVDTSVCHLAGALGVPTWTLVDCGADWRWLTEREDSPWYPTMRLFRQRHPGDWTDVVEQVKAALSSFVTKASTK